MSRLAALSRAALAVACLASLAVGCSGGGDAGAAAPGSTTPGSQPGPASADGLLVSLAGGQVRGDAVGGSRQFLKIPYAKPPTGERRWKAPEPAEPWTGVRHETDFAEGCPQNANSQGPASVNEDCLYANVWAPEDLVDKAPVMVWIHGGGNFAGSAGDLLPTTQVRWYDGQYFASRQGVVLVSFNYRLGPMGFFSHPALAGEGSPPANQGLLDQHLLLQWVHDNVAAFGGDPGKVTIFGESAGSADVCYHVASPRSRGLFHRAISESGGCTMAGGLERTIERARPGMEAFARALGCDTAPDVLACLRAKPAAEIMNSASQPEPMSGTMSSAFSFGAIVDGPGGYLPDPPRALFERGEAAKVPYLLGSNADEGTLFVLNATVASEDDYRAALATRFPGAADEIAARYPVSAFGGDPKKALAAVVGDSGLICGTHDTARVAQRAGLPVFMYNFAIPWAISPDALGAAHASEMSHVFGNPYKADAAGTAISEAMNRYWATFAATGDPNFEGAPVRWPAFAPSADDSDERLQFGPADITVVKDLKKNECAFWRSRAS